MSGYLCAMRIAPSLLPYFFYLSIKYPVQKS